MSKQSPLNESLKSLTDVNTYSAARHIVMSALLSFARDEITAPALEAMTNALNALSMSSNSERQVFNNHCANDPYRT